MRVIFHGEDGYAVEKPLMEGTTIEAFAAHVGVNTIDKKPRLVRGGQEVLVMRETILQDGDELQFIPVKREGAKPVSDHYLKAWAHWANNVWAQGRIR